MKAVKESIMKKKILSVLTVSVLISILAAAPLAYAEADSSASDSRITLAVGVTAEMCSPSYWKSKAGVNAERVLMSHDEIDALNRDMLAAQGTCMYDLEAMEETYTASVPEVSIPERDYYINGELIDKNAYFTKMLDAMKATGYSGERKLQYAVVTKNANMKDWPTDDILGYSATDADDELQSSSMVVNEPFVIRQKCEIDGKTFYSGFSTNCSGWVSGDCLAICNDKQEWLDSWKVDTDSKDFIVVTQDKVVLEPSVLSPATSEVKLLLGTVLKLVPENEIPKSIAERGPWNNYAVYLPTRAEDGSYKRETALVAQHYDVSIGYEPLTSGNILDAAFSCLGDRYGWGGMLDSMDCSMYTRSVYRCFGLELPRNTTWQLEIPGARIDLAEMTDGEKAAFISTLYPGALLYFNGHTMIYTGSENGVGYVISDTGSLSDSAGELEVRSMYSVILNPLTVRRRNGTTWLNNLDSVVSFDKAGTGLSGLSYSDGKASVSGAGEGSVLIHASYDRERLSDCETLRVSDGSYDISAAAGDSLMLWSGTGYMKPAAEKVVIEE